MKKAFTAVSLVACAALISAALLCSCSEKTEEKPANNGVPDRVVSRPAQSDSASVPADVTDVNGDLTSQNPVTSDSYVTDGESAQTSGLQQNPVSTDEEPVEDDITVEENSLSDCKAMEYLKLLNSDKVHAALIEASSHDNENASSVEREYFVDGDNAVFINDDTKIIMDDTLVTVVDMDEMTYYTYPREDEDAGANFGYDISCYTLVSKDEDEDGTLTEVYEVSDRGGIIKSTWTIFPSGNVTVADVSKEAGSYFWYSFSIIESDVSKMDMSIPDGVVETAPEDFF